MHLPFPSIIYLNSNVVSKRFFEIGPEFVLHGQQKREVITFLFSIARTNFSQASIHLVFI